jgi:hypothetical protein
MHNVGMNSASLRIGLISTAIVFFVGCSTDTFVGDDDGGSDSGYDAIISLDSGPIDASADGGDSAADGAAGDVVTVPTHYRVFVTSGMFTGNLGGLAGADAICMTAASSAKLGGTWMAWLSTSTGTPGIRFKHSVLLYVLVNGTEVAIDWAHLTGGLNLETAITVNEFGEDVVADASTPNWVMTSTDNTGNAFFGNGSCTDYTTSSVAVTTTAGNSSSVLYNKWTVSSEWTCSQGAALYCFEQ